MLYNSVRITGSFIFKLLGMRVEGVENLPHQGGVILAANHVSNWDPVLIGCAVPRTIHYMAKQELFDIKPLGVIITAVHAFPVKRDVADRQALKTALQILAEDKVLGIFPQGGRRELDQEIELKSGIALIVLKSECPVVPLAITINNPKSPLGCKIRLGKPIYFEELPNRKLSVENIATVTSRISKEISFLLHK